MNEFKQFLERSFSKFPESQIEDFLKYIYQSEFGPEHMILNKEYAQDCLNNEVKSLVSNNLNLYDVISPNFVRINLYPYIKHNYNLNELLELFILSANLTKGSNNSINLKLSVLENMVKENKLIFNENVESIISNYKQSPCAIHHSNIYRENYNPHYRLISSSLIPIEMKISALQEFINNLDQSKMNIIALEGRCCSGKTTITSKLENVTIIHADDFFSTNEDPLNFNLLTDLLSKLKPNQSITFTAYDCSSKSYITKNLENIKNTIIIEGVYSYHYKLRDFYTHLVYLNVSKETQNERLKNRCGENKLLYNKFINTWIPNEENYFNNNDIISKADIII